VLEINPLPGLNPVFSDLPILCRLADIAYEELLGRIVKSAIRRCDDRTGGGCAS
jgi:D-alanine-D-alanine ligase